MRTAGENKARPRSGLGTGHLWPSLHRAPQGHAVMTECRLACRLTSTRTTTSSSVATSRTRSPQATRCSVHAPLQTAFDVGRGPRQIGAAAVRDWRALPHRSGVTDRQPLQGALCAQPPGFDTRPLGRANPLRPCGRSAPRSFNGNRIRCAWRLGGEEISALHGQLWLGPSLNGRRKDLSGIVGSSR